jgi:hypothetical protein
VLSFFAQLFQYLLNYLKENNQTKEVIKVAKKEKNACGCGCLPLGKKGSSVLKSEAKKSKKAKK